MGADAPTKVSCVVPVRDEAATLAELHRRHADVMAAQGWDHELILVDDGSVDSTWTEVLALADADHRVVGIRLERSAGILEAIAVGLAAATGTVMCTMDGDLEARPEDLTAIVQGVIDGADMVSGSRENQHARPTTRWIASATLRAVMWFAPHRPTDFGCGMKAFSPTMVRRVLDDPSGGTGLPFAFSLLRAARSYGEVPVPWEDQGHASHFSPAQLTRNLAAFTAMTFRGPVAAWSRVAPLAAAVSVATTLSGRPARRRAGSVSTVAVMVLSLAARDLRRRSRSEGRPGSTAIIVARAGSSGTTP